jgi:hypothetical protein
VFILGDIRLALRLFRRTPVPTAIALVSIALSVGATAVVFAAVKSVLIDPLPYARAGELVQIRSEYPGHRASAGDWVIWNDWQEIARRTRTLEAVRVSQRDLRPGRRPVDSARGAVWVEGLRRIIFGARRLAYARSQHSS